MDIKINIIKMKRKTMQIKIEEDCTVTVKVPLNTDKKTINDFIESHKAWIIKNTELQRRKSEGIETLSELEIKEISDKAKQVIPPLVEYYANLMGVTYSKLQLKSIKSRWGSCSSNGTIVINIRLMCTNKNVLEYVIVHELAHRVHMNHSQAFYNLVEKYKPDYRECKKYLKENGFRIMKQFEGNNK